MSRQADEIRISSYLDGELSPSDTQKLSDSIKQDPYLQKLTLDLLRTKVLFQSVSRTDLQDSIPSVIIEKIEDRKDKGFFSKISFSQLAIAAMIVLFLAAGFKSQIFTQAPSTNNLTQFMQVPKKYDRIVQTTLDKHRSGESQSWLDENAGVALLVTPIKTYRDIQGVFYRLYQMEINAKNRQQKYTCLAYRNEEKRWQTKTIFFDNNNSQLNYKRSSIKQL